MGVWIGAVVAFGAGCLHGDRTPPLPRPAHPVRIGVVALDAALTAPVVEGLRRDPRAGEVLTFDAVEALSFEERTICLSTQCPPAHPKVCAWARERGLDYFVFAKLIERERSQQAPGPASGSLLDIHAPSSGGGRTTSYAASARLLLEVSDVASCAKVGHLSRQIVRETTQVPRQGGGPARARAELLAAIPAELASTFPAHVVVGDDGRVRAPRPELPLPDGLYAAYRDGRYQGTARVERAGTPAQRLTRLTCCFQPGAGDVLVRQERVPLFELAPSFSLSTLTRDGTANVAPGFGLRLRIRTLDHGWQGGVAIDSLFARGANVTLATLEGGYQWRPGSAFMVGVIAGGGGGVASTSAGDAAGDPQPAGAHAMAALVASWQPGRDWFLALDAGYIYSARYGLKEDARPTVPPPTFELRGPLVRLAGGLR